jgi:hypothetical protein
MRSLNSLIGQVRPAHRQIIELLRKRQGSSAESEKLPVLAYNVAAAK